MLNTLRHALEAIEAAVGWVSEDEIAERYVECGDNLRTLIAQLEALEKQEPHGYIATETYAGEQPVFDFAASYESLVHEHVNDALVRLQSNDLPVPEYHVKPFWFHPAPTVLDGWKLVPEDLATHLNDWETACRIADTHEVDGCGYWKHQLKTIANIKTMLAAAPEYKGQEK